MKKIILIAIAFLTMLPGAFAKSKDLKDLDSSVVRIVAFGEEGPKSHGTGFFLNKKGHILTNAHVVIDLQTGKIEPGFLVLQLVGEDVYLYEAEIACNPSPEKDLAVLKINTRHAKPIPFARKSFDKPDNVVAVGFPGANDDDRERANFILQLQGLFVRGEVDLSNGKKVDSSLKSFAEPVIQKGAIEKISYFSYWGLSRNHKMKVIQHNAAIRGGNSGGPLLNENKELIGVNTSVQTKEPGEDEKKPNIIAQLSRSSHLDEVVEYLKQNNISFEYSSFFDRGNTILVAILIVGGLLLAILIIKIKNPEMGASTFSESSRTSGAYASSGTHAARQNVKIEFFGAPGAAYKFLVDSQKIVSCENYIILGRNGDFCDVCVNEPSVSSQHLGISVKQNSIYIEDRNSSNGTYIGGIRLQPFKPAKISPADTIKIGALSGRIFFK